MKDKSHATLQVLPRGRWTRDVPLFPKDPNLCASNFNEELLACVGPERLIETFRHFSSSSRNKNNGAAQATSCKKFYRGYGLHPNYAGSQLLGALISQSVSRALECERSQTSASPPQTSGHRKLLLLRKCAPSRSVFLKFLHPPYHFE